MKSAAKPVMCAGLRRAADRGVEPRAAEAAGDRDGRPPSTTERTRSSALATCFRFGMNAGGGVLSIPRADASRLVTNSASSKFGERRMPASLATAGRYFF
jgi:hypothetical protein